MRALIQRVAYGSVRVDRELIAEIHNGLVILVGVGRGDGEEQASFLAERISSLRIFNDRQGKMNHSIREVGGEILVVPQFTLYADASSGHCPDLIRAAPSVVAHPLVELFSRQLVLLGIPTQTGRFGANMLVSLLDMDIFRVYFIGAIPSIGEF